MVRDRSFERGPDVDVEMAAGIGAHLGVRRTRCGGPREYGRRDDIVLSEGEEDWRCDLTGVTTGPVAGDPKGDTGGGPIAPGRAWRVNRAKARLGVRRGHHRHRAGRADARHHVRWTADGGTELVAQTGGDQTERQRQPETGQIAQPVGERNLGDDGGDLPVPRGGFDDVAAGKRCAPKRDPPGVDLSPRADKAAACQSASWRAMSSS